MGVEWFWAVDGDLAELLMKLGKDFVGKAGTDVADCFVGFGFGVVASEEESTIERCAFSFTVVCS